MCSHKYSASQPLFVSVKSLSLKKSTHVGFFCVCAVKHNFETGSTSTGIACMIPLDILKKHSSGFFVGGTCVFGVKFVKVVTTKANVISETLFVKKMNTFNEAKTYTWNIEDFFALKNTSCSPEFEIGGYNW